MAWDHYTHPEFGFLSPTPRLRRELRIAVLSGLFGVLAGAACVIALSASYRDTDPPADASVVPASKPAAVPSSHAKPPSAGEATAPDRPRAPASSDAAASDGSPSLSHSAANESHGAAREGATTATAAGFDNGREERARSAAMPGKTPEVTPRRQNRQRNEVASDWRVDAADPRIGRVDTNNRSGRVGHANAREGAYPRQGFWEWSR